MTASRPRFGCIEAGGTKFVVGVASGPDDIGATIRLDTRTPAETIDGVIAWLKDQGPLDAIGIASFGPAELDRGAANWGFITHTTKPGWSNSDFARRVSRALNLPVGFDTDVNGAALAEARWGASHGDRIGVYITVGTGIGGGVTVDGKILRGLSHAEMGHVRPVRHADDSAFKGVCPFHADCFEGLASGPAIKARWGVPLSELPRDHGGHMIIASYIAQLVVMLQSIMEPGRIILGGGVMATAGLRDLVKSEATRLGSGYFRGDAQDIVVAPALGDKAGLLGGLALAMDITAR